MPPNPDPDPDRNDKNCYKPFTKRNFKWNLFCYTGEWWPGFLKQAHHVFPQARDLQANFDKVLGPNGNQVPWFGSWWESKDHNRNWWAYNQRWRVWFFGKDLSPLLFNDVLTEGRTIMTDFKQVPLY